MDAGPMTRPRRRDAAATRAALLAAARTLMVEHGVEGTSTRDVASAAGVNQALVYRYFGSKEKLFAEAASSDADTPEDIILTTPLADLPRVLLERILDVVTSEDASELSRLVAAANDQTVRAVLQHRIETSFATRLAARLEGPEAALRAELFAAVLVGVGFLRHKVGTRALSTADREVLVAQVNRMVAPLLEP
ncbi:TetR/AcrR family transcriptional regulator [Actinophytocola oryzae]|uniref:TetR family transcriptional regulator n=1 Tax=Actinophytocola oryzae TaxID=502181 RepID=A0A4R7VAQ2_9PSEU|nr:TetR/AcrR family transcriptional regulator [Actinophytocola oryzae]TDV46045.1 TetR family transcriptional regulator [Actinophytocola oryzae]